MKDKLCSADIEINESKGEKDSCCGDFCMCSGKTAKNTFSYKYYEASYKTLFNPRSGFKYQDWYQFDYLSRLLDPPQLA
jgi:hypothetical protein